jgi:hypothetical protein
MKEEIESTTLINKQSLEQLKAMGKGLGWDPFIEEYCRGTTKMVHCEIANRGKRRAKILKMDKQAEEYGDLDESYHEESMVHMKQARKLFEEANKKIDAKTKKKYDEIAKKPENLEKIRKEVSERMNLAISETDIKPEDVPEITRAFEDTFKIAKEKGFSGIVNEIDKDLDELIKLRLDKEKNRGREHRSPVAWWKWFVIVGIIGTLIAIAILAIYFSGGTATAIALWLLSNWDAAAGTIGLFIGALLASGC